MLNSFTRWFLAWFLAVIVLLCLGLGIRVAAATERAGSTPAHYAYLKSDRNPKSVCAAGDFANAKTPS